MPKFRKKPVVIEAVHYDEHAALYGWKNAILDAHPWLDEAYDPGDILSNVAVMEAGTNNIGQTYIEIKTLEGTMRCDVGDWIIRGIKGEIYPCKPDIFAATYEPILEQKQ